MYKAQVFSVTRKSLFRAALLVPLIFLLIFSYKTTNFSLLHIKTFFANFPGWHSKYAVPAPLPPETRIAVCLVGGARRFELTGPSILERVVNVLSNNTDLFLNSPLDENSYKFYLLKEARRIGGIRIFSPEKLPETDEELDVLTSHNSPNGIQGLLQYFNLVEGCLNMIEKHQARHGFRYDWIVRTRVDSYWSNRLTSDHFIPNTYVVPQGSRYGGLNDRFGSGDLDSSRVALSRLTLIPSLHAAGFRELNSESAFQAQLTSRKVNFEEHQLPFCIISDRSYQYPPSSYGVPVASISSMGPLSGAKCRPCKPICKSRCASGVVSGLSRGWGWIKDDRVELCDASGPWEEGWEEVFDREVGVRLAKARKKVVPINMTECISGFLSMKARVGDWDTPPVTEICRLGLEI